MDEHISVREWQERFTAGTFDNDEQAGWEDFYQPLDDRRLQTLARFVMRITDPFILDHYYVWFKDNTPAVGPFYGDVRFMPLDEDAEKYFLISLDSPYERTKWALITQRYGYGAPEFECKDIRQILIPDAPEKYYLSSEMVKRLLYSSSAAPRDTGSTTSKE